MNFLSGSKIKYFLLILIGIFFSFYLTGCASRQTIPLVSIKYLDNLGMLVAGTFGPDGKIAGEDKQKLSTRTNRNYTISSLISQTTSEGFKRIQFELSNATSHALNLQYRIFWFDANGMKTSSDMVGWQPIQVFAKGMYPVNITSKSPQAQSFKLYIRSIQYTD